MIFDEIAAEHGLKERLARLSADGLLELLVTSRQAEECRQARKPHLVEILEGIPVREIGATPFILGVSRLDVDRLGATEPYDSLRAFAQSPRHVNDHLGVATADSEDAPFVTEDRRLHGFASTGLGLHIWWWSDLRTRIESIDPASARPDT